MQDSPLEKRLFLVNIVLFVLIGALAFLILTEDRAIPAEPPIDEIRQTLAAIQPDPTSDVAPGVKYPKFGKAPAFDTIVPIPTPTPTPVPTPVPPPSLCEALKTWKMQGVAGRTVFLEDLATKESIILDLDIADTQTRPIKFNNVTMTVRLVGTDGAKLEAKFEYIDPTGARQECSLSMLEATQ